jgi:hypothetical protein
MAWCGELVHSVKSVDASLILYMLHDTIEVSECKAHHAVSDPHKTRVTSALVLGQFCGMI